MAGLGLVALAVVLKLYPSVPAPPDLIAGYSLFSAGHELLGHGRWRFGGPRWDWILITLGYLVVSGVTIGWATATIRGRLRSVLWLTAIPVLSASVPTVNSVTAVLLLLPGMFVGFSLVSVIALLAGRRLFWRHEGAD